MAQHPADHHDHRDPLFLARSLHNLPRLVALRDWSLTLPDADRQRFLAEVAAARRESPGADVVYVAERVRRRWQRDA